MADESSTPPPLDYSSNGLSPSSWPVDRYLIAMVWAGVSMRFYTAATVSYSDENWAQFRTQVALLTCAGLRLVWARLRREQGKGWVFYIVLLYLAPLVWAVAAPMTGRLGTKLWHGPLIK